jgi:hypothetical protein
MRMLFQYFRQCFCNHNFETTEYEYANTAMWGILALPHTYKSMHCKKCGFHMKKKVK